MQPNRSSSSTETVNVDRLEKRQVLTQIQFESSNHKLKQLAKTFNLRRLVESELPHNTISLRTQYPRVSLFQYALTSSPRSGDKRFLISLILGIFNTNAEQFEHPSKRTLLSLLNLDLNLMHDLINELEHNINNNSSVSRKIKIVHRQQLI